MVKKRGRRWRRYRRRQSCFGQQANVLADQVIATVLKPAVAAGAGRDEKTEPENFSLRNLVWLGVAIVRLGHCEPRKAQSRERYGAGSSTASHPSPKHEGEQQLETAENGCHPQRSRGQVDRPPYGLTNNQAYWPCFGLNFA